MLVPIPGTNCWVTVTYCDRLNTFDPLSNHDWEMYITSVTPVPIDTGCNGLSPHDLIQGAYDYFYLATNGDPNDIYTDSCAGGMKQHVHLYAMSCWKVEHDTVNNEIYVSYYPCGTQHCIASWFQCLDGLGHVIKTDYTQTSTGGNTCNPVPWPLPWVDDVCYVALCGTPI